MPGLVTANEQGPLIEIDWTEHRMRLHDFAQRQAIAGQDCSPQSRSRLLQRRPCRCRVDIATWTDLFRRASRLTPIGNQLKRKTVQDRARQLAAGFDCWYEEHPKSGRQFVGAPYIMLHSLSHLLITSLALECGYPSSSIRERVYAGESG